MPSPTTPIRVPLQGSRSITARDKIVDRECAKLVQPKPKRPL